VIHFVLLFVQKRTVQLDLVAPPERFEKDQDDQWRPVSKDTVTGGQAASWSRIELVVSKADSKGFQTLLQREASLLKEHEPDRKDAGNTFNHELHLANYAVSHRSAQVPLAQDPTAALKHYWKEHARPANRQCANCGCNVTNPAEHKVCEMSDKRLKKAVAAAKAYRPRERKSVAGGAAGGKRKNSRAADLEESDPETTVTETEHSDQEDDRSCAWKGVDEDWTGPRRKAQQSSSAQPPASSNANGQGAVRRSGRAARPANSAYAMLDSTKNMGHITETEDDDDGRDPLNDAFLEDDENDL
jgi:hypothetical protein